MLSEPFSCQSLVINRILPFPESCRHQIRIEVNAVSQSESCRYCFLVQFHRVTLAKTTGLRQSRKIALKLLPRRQNQQRVQRRNNIVKHDTESIANSAIK